MSPRLGKAVFHCKGKITYLVNTVFDPTLAECCKAAATAGLNGPSPPAASLEEAGQLWTMRCCV